MSLLSMMVVLATAVPGPGRRADLVLLHGIVHTMDPRRPKAQAVAVSGTTVAAVGTDAEIAALVGPGTRVIDLEGRTVIPGLKESHGHLLGLGLLRTNVDLVGTRGYPQVAERVAVAIKTRKPGEWILGRGWHEGKWPEPAAGAVRGFPTHEALSAVSSDNPVVLERADGHAILVNAKAMELMGITSDTRAPEGGEIVRDGTGRPTGVFVDNAQDLIRVPSPDAAQKRSALRLALLECLRNGITSFDDAGSEADVIGIYEEWAREGTLPLRINVMLAGFDALRRREKPQVGLGGGFLTIRSVKLYADGALGSRGAALLEPYGDDPGNSGFFTTPPETILAAVRDALARGFQACTHAIGDRGNRMVLDAYEKALRERPGVADRRFRIEHAQILDEADIPRFAKLGVIASMQGIHATSDRPWAADRLGMARVTEGAYVWQKLLRTGARIANGTDAPVEDVSPLKSFYASVTRQDESGQPPGGFDPDQRMTREQALRSYTLDGAYAMFQEKSLGSIEPGKLADLTVLSTDIMTVPEAEILGIQVLATIVDGKIRYALPLKESVGAKNR